VSIGNFEIRGGLDGIYTTFDPVRISTASNAPERNLLNAMITTAKTMDGHVGQVVHASSGRIVWESEPFEAKDEALDAARDKVSDVFADLFYEAPDSLSRVIRRLKAAA
jgi:hypothetical protein